MAERAMAELGTPASTIVDYLRPWDEDMPIDQYSKRFDRLRY
jgi:hypothetical protein